MTEKDGSAPASRPAKAEPAKQPPTKPAPVEPTEPEPTEPEPTEPEPTEPERTEAPRTATDAEESLSARERLRISLLKPTRGQAVVGVLLAALAFAGVTQIRSAGADDTYDGLRPEELVQALNGLSAASRRAERDIAELRETRDDLEDDTMRQESARKQAQREAETLGILAGTLPARGPGIRITVEDPDDELNLTNLLDAIEELRDAYAEAIEINDRVRVIAQTSFADDPEGIEVDGTKIRSPYVIDVIGNADTLAGGLDIEGGFIADVELGGGSVEVERSERIEVSVTREPFPIEYAEPAQSQ